MSEPFSMFSYGLCAACLRVHASNEPCSMKEDAARALLLRSFDAFIASYEREWGAGDWGNETDMLKRVRAALAALPKDGAA